MGIFDARQSSTQSHLDIDDIRENLVVLKSGKVSLVLETSSLNFELLADREQDVRIITFAGLLNSLHFPIQIVIRTQRKDVSKYKELLAAYRNRVNSAGIKQQLQIYEDFISNLTQNSVILDKRFYAIIPTVLATSYKTGTVRQFFGKPAQVYDQDVVVKKALLELSPKRDHLIKQFSNMGLSAKQMNNDELIRLYYSIYEPDKVGLDVLDLREDEMTGAVVEAGIQPAPDEDQAQTADNPFAKNPVQGGTVTQVSAGQGGEAPASG